MSQRPDCCALAQKWGVSIEVLVRVILAAIKFRGRLGRTVYIISGHRSAREQQTLRDQGRPAAADQLSNHRTFPATAIDVAFSGAPLSDSEKRIWGELVQEAGLRWGGGSPVVAGIPSDWQHVDLGPRRQGV